MQPNFEVLGTFTPDSLIADGFPLLSESGTLLAGQNLTRGALLGIVTASGKYRLSVPAAVDGSEAPSAILAESVDATAADKPCVFYVSGRFNTSAMNLGGHDVADIKAGLRNLNIYLTTAQAAV